MMVQPEENINEAQKNKTSKTEETNDVPQLSPKNHPAPTITATFSTSSSHH